jgi:hypothetical protein
MLKSNSSALLVDAESFTDIYRLSEVVSAMEGVNYSVELTALQELGNRVKAKKQPGVTGDSRFFIQVWRDITQVDFKGDTKAKYSLNLLKDCYGPEAGRTMDNIKTNSYGENKHLMFSLLCLPPHKKLKETPYACIASLLSIVSENSSFISHVAVTKSLYHQSDYGGGGDKKSFRCRGIAKALVGLCQCYLKTLKKKYKLYSCVQLNESFETKSMWKSLGFEVVDAESFEMWPDSEKKILKDYTGMKLSLLFQDTNVRLTSICKPVSIFFVHGVLNDEGAGLSHPLFLKPFLKCDIDPNAQHSEDEGVLAKYHFLKDESNGSDTINLLCQGSLSALLLECHRFKRNKIMREKGCFEVIEALNNIMECDVDIPKEALDYCFLAMMMESSGLYSISSDTVSGCYDQSFRGLYSLTEQGCATLNTSEKSGNQYDENDVIYSSMKVELDLIKSESGKVGKKFLLPFYFKNHWTLIYYMFISDHPVFFYVDSWNDTEHSYVPYKKQRIKNNLIPDNVLWLTMDTPFWPLDTTAYWICVPNVFQKERECAGRVLLHGYVLTSSSSPHSSLLQLHNLDQTVSDNLNVCVRSWINEMLNEKHFIPPKFFRMNPEEYFNYNEDWLKENALTLCISKGEYHHRTENVRKFDLNKHYRSLIPEQPSARENEEINLLSQDLMYTTNVTATPEQMVHGDSINRMHTPDLNTEFEDIRNKEFQISEGPSNTTVFPQSPILRNAYDDFLPENVRTLQFELVPDGDNITERHTTDFTNNDNTEKNCETDLIMFEHDAYLKSFINGPTEQFQQSVPGTEVNVIAIPPNHNELSHNECEVNGDNETITSIGMFDEEENNDRQTNVTLNFESVFDETGNTQDANRAIEEEQATPFENSEPIFEMENTQVLHSQSECTGGAMDESGINQSFETEDLSSISEISDEHDEGEETEDEVENGGKCASLHSQRECMGEDMYEDRSSKNMDNEEMSSISEVGSKINDEQNESKVSEDEVQNASVMDMPRHELRLNCNICKEYIFDSTPGKCLKCNKHIHRGKCALLVESSDGGPVTACPDCVSSFKQYKRYRTSFLDLNVSATLCFEDDEYDETFRKEKEENDVYNAMVFNQWLSLVTHMTKRKSRKAVDLYYGKTDDNDIRRIPSKLLFDSLLYYFKDEIPRINMSYINNGWYKLKNATRKFVNLHGYSFANYEVYSRLYKCEHNEWRYIKLNTLNSRVLKKKEKFAIVDTLDKRKMRECAWYSFTNDKSRTEIRMIPEYFLLKWRKVYNESFEAEKQSEPDAINDFVLTMKKARRKYNQWIEVEPGASKKTLATASDQLPKSYKIQPYGESSCVLICLANALHYINDWTGRDELVKQIPASLDYDKFSEFAQSRKAFAAYLMNHRVKGYTTTLKTNFDVLHDKSIWPTLCILKGSDKSVNHAIAVVEDLIFESNSPHAMKLTRENLDWCCSSSDMDVKFVGVPYAYKFHRSKPTPLLLLRGHNHNTEAVNAMIQCMDFIGDSDAKSMLEREKLFKLSAYTSNDPFIWVRKIINRKPLGYQPVCIKTLEELLLLGDDVNPLMLLIHAKNTFHFGVICVVKSHIFNGRKDPISLLTLKNLYNAICPTEEYIPGSNVEIIKGYVFRRKKQDGSGTENDNANKRRKIVKMAEKLISS